MVLGEAMKAGLPIVTTQLGPVNEIVCEGENALVVEPRDPHALAAAIRVLATDSTMRESFQRRSRELAGSLSSWEQTCDVIADQIALLLQSSHDMKQSTKMTPTQLL